jgi:hypothetical protein
MVNQPLPRPSPRSTTAYLAWCLSQGIEPVGAIHREHADRVNKLATKAKQVFVSTENGPSNDGR